MEFGCPFLTVRISLILLLENIINSCITLFALSFLAIWVLLNELGDEMVKYDNFNECIQSNKRDAKVFRCT
jgi:hypothetical protein